MREQVMQQPIELLTLRIPTALVEQARQRARAAGCSLNHYIVEAVQLRVSQDEQLAGLTTEISNDHP
jgi:hypothetical protein